MSCNFQYFGDNRSVPDMRQGIPGKIFYLNGGIVDDVAVVIEQKRAFQCIDVNKGYSGHKPQHKSDIKSR